MDILSKKDGSVLSIEFNRPEKKNAITATMYLELASLLSEAEGSKDIYCVVVKGSEAIFTAGNDLEDFIKNPPRTLESPLYQFLFALAQLSKPVVAAVAGAAVGIGTTMLLHCDLVYAADNAKFSLPFSQLGLCPEAASSYLLPELVGYQRAAEKLLLGEAFTAAEAREMGLVTRILPAGDLHEFANKQAERLAVLPGPSVQKTKALLKQNSRAQITQRLQLEGAAFAELLDAPEAKEAIVAFLEKRRPNFAQFRG